MSVMVVSKKAEKCESGCSGAGEKELKSVEGKSEYYVMRKKEEKKEASGGSALYRGC